MGRLSHGLAAGAVGTTLLNAATYLDMAIRGRPASTVPEKGAERLARQAGIPLGEGRVAETRKTAIGALLGFATGASAGAVYGLVRPLAPGVSKPVAAVLVGLGTMAATDAGNASMGTTSHPRTWTAEEWASDIVPHLVFGAGVALTYDALAN
jgi:hypothetical protein